MIFNTFKPLTLILCAAIIFTSCKKNTEENRPVAQQLDIETVDQRMNKFLTDNNFPGASLAVSKNGKLVYRKGYGLSDKEANEKVTVDSRFRIASVSKLYTSAAIMILIENGKLEMEQKVFGADGVLGTTYGSQPYKQHVENIKVSDLLRHTIGGWGQDNDPAFSNKVISEEAIISYTLDDLALTKAPGTAFSYSNFGYMILSRIIETVSGKSYVQFVKTEILDKINASKTEIAGSLLRDRKSDEVKYYGQGDDVNYVYDYTQFRRAAAAFGWMSTPTDMLLFANAVDGSTTRQDIINSSTIDIMTTTTAASKGFGFTFGSGWVVEGDEWFWWGSLPGTFAILYRNANGTCIAAAANGRRQPNSENGLNSFIPIINFIASDASIPWQDINQF